MYALPNIPPKDIENTIEEERENTEILKTNEEVHKGSSTEAINTSIPTLEQESPLLEPEDAKEMHTSFMKKDTTDLLLKKTSPSISTQESNIKGNERRPTTKDVSAVGSLAELETTHGSYPSSLQEEKNTKTEVMIGGEISIQTEPARSLEEDTQKREIPLRILWAPDRAASAMMGLNTNAINKKRELKNSKLPEKVIFYLELEFNIKGCWE